MIVSQVHQVQEAPGEIGVPKGQLVRQDKRVIKETEGFQDCWDLKERKVLLDHQVQQVHRVHPGLGVFQDLKDPEGPVVDLEVLVTKVTLGHQGFLVGMGRQDYRDHKGHRGPEDQQDHKGHMGLLDLLALQVLQGLLDYLLLLSF